MRLVIYESLGQS